MGPPLCAQRSATHVSGTTVNQCSRAHVRSPHARNRDGAIGFQYRPWLVLPRRTVELPAGPLAISRGAFFPSLLHAANATSPVTLANFPRDTVAMNLPWELTLASSMSATVRSSVGSRPRAGGSWKPSPSGKSEWCDCSSRQPFQTPNRGRAGTKRKRILVPLNGEKPETRNPKPEIRTRNPKPETNSNER